MRLGAGLPGVVLDPVVCGASCATSSAGDNSNDNDPEQVTAYVDNNGNPIWPSEANYTIADFAPGGPVATELGANLYHEVTDANDLWATYAIYGPGVYYLDGSIQVKKNDAPSNAVEMTLVVTQQITQFNLVNDFEGYYPQSADPTYRLALFANGGGPSAACGSKDLHVVSSNAYFSGIVFAPYGQADFSVSSATTSHGCVIAYEVSMSASSLNMLCDPGSNQTQGSINLMQ